MGATVHTRALQRAAQVLGGKEALRQFLEVTTHELEGWMAGLDTPPTDVFLMVVDVISAGSNPVERSKIVRQQVRSARNAWAIARERRALIRQALGAQRGEDYAARAKPPTVLDFLQARYEPREGVEMVETALEVAIRATGAAMGNVQLHEADGLHIVAQRGFQQPFLDFFACVSGPHCACGAAVASGQRIVVPDVAADPLFAGKPSGEAMLTAGALAVQSTPLVGAHGELIGVLSTHYVSPHQLTEREHDVLDHITRRTAFWLDGGRL